MEGIMRDRYQQFVSAVAFFVAFLPFAAAAQSGGNIDVLWLGQSAMRVTIATGKVSVIDPWLLKNPVTPAEYKNLDALGKIDLILVAHAHGDHLGDAPGLAKK